MKRKSLFNRLGRRTRRKQIVITAEKSELFIIRQQPKGEIRARCAQCAEEIECLTVEQALLLTAMTARELFRLVEAQGIHFCETNDGRLLLCPNSLAPLVRTDGHEVIEMKTKAASR